jgi:hypothetical protein
MQDAQQVIDLFHEAADATRNAACRQGSIEVIHSPGRLIAIGDLHDNPAHFDALVRIAQLDESHNPAPSGDDAETQAVHITFHEVIHSDKLLNNLDFSYRALARIAQLKARYPERVHMLLANHELAQIVGAGIVKDGVRCVEAFNDGLAYVFGDAWEEVAAALGMFIRALPIGLRCVTPKGDLLCLHSLPATGAMARFDASILSRDLTDDDYQPRVGSAHLLVWGRGYDAEQIEDLVERWGVNLFLLGHEHAENGYRLIEPAVVVLNSDHERGVYLDIDLDHPPTLGQVPQYVRSLSALLA